MKKENDKLHESNEELKRSISDLQKMIRSLKDHISSLQQFNSSFRHSLSSLQDAIEHFTSESGKLGTKIESITGLEKSFHQLRDEFSKFSSCFDETKLILTHQNADIMRQLTYLTDLIKINEERVPQLGKIKELAIIQAQFLLAIQGIKEYQEQLKSTNQELKQAKEKCEQEHQQMETSRKACDAMLVKFEKIFGAERRNQVSLKALQALRARRVDNLEARTLYHIQQENLRRAHK
jgi:FtsZ-binding cell division protein ZapB